MRTHSQQSACAGRSSARWLLSATSSGVSPFCVMRYNASAFFDQSNQEAKNASAHYMRKFWGQSIPPKELTELDVYDAVKSNFYEPHELTFAHFISGSELDEP